MAVIAWIVVGLISGFIANKLMDKVGAGLLFDLVLGMAGAVAAGYVVSSVAQDGVAAFDLWSAVVALMGASAVLFVDHNIAERRAVV